MPATSQQGFTCAACILATGAVGLLCTFAGGAACASRVAGERFSTTMTAKDVADFFVITDLRLTQPHTLGKVVSALRHRDRRIGPSVLRSILWRLSDSLIPGRGTPGLCPLFFRIAL